MISSYIQTECFQLILLSSCASCESYHFTVVTADGFDQRKSQNMADNMFFGASNRQAVSLSFVVLQPFGARTQQDKVVVTQTYLWIFDLGGQPDFPLKTWCGFRDIGWMLIMFKIIHWNIFGDTLMKTDRWIPLLEEIRFIFWNLLDWVKMGSHGLQKVLVVLIDPRSQENQLFIS